MDLGPTLKDSVTVIAPAYTLTLVLLPLNISTKSCLSGVICCKTVQFWDGTTTIRSWSLLGWNKAGTMQRNALELFPTIDVDS